MGRCLGRTCTIIGMALLIGQCSSKPPVAPPQRDGLSVVALSAPIVLRVSPWIAAKASPDSVRTIALGEVPWCDSVTYGDIQLTCTTQDNSRTEGLFVLDPVTSEWQELEGALPIRETYCFGNGPCFASAIRLLSQNFGANPKRALNNDGGLRAAAQHAWGFEARVLEYNPVYDFATIQRQQTTGNGTLGYRNDTLWMVSRFKDRATGLPVDSLIAYDLDGTQLRSKRVPFSSPHFAVVGTRGLWLIPAESPRRLVCLDEQDNILHDFELPSSDHVPHTLTETGGRLWLARRAGVDLPVRLTEVDIPRSDSAGSQVALREIQTEMVGTNYIAWTGNGFVVVDDSVIRELDSDARPISEFPLPINFIEGLTTGAGSIWIAHHGPSEVSTDAILLTRFALE